MAWGLAVAGWASLLVGAGAAGWAVVAAAGSVVVGWVAWAQAMRAVGCL